MTALTKAKVLKTLVDLIFNNRTNESPNKVLEKAVSVTQDDPVLHRLVSSVAKAIEAKLPELLQKGLVNNLQMQPIPVASKQPKASPNSKKS